MQLILLIKFSLACNFQYTLSSHDPIYIEQFLQPGQTLCINATIEYSIFIFNSLGNSTFKTFDQYNIERELGYVESYEDAAAVLFGKMTGSLVITNSKAINKSSVSFISLSAISFPKDECEIKIITNQNKNFVFFSFDDSTVCYFNGNGINYRYQFYVSSGTIEIRPPHNISNSVFINNDLNYQLHPFDVKSIVSNIVFKFLSKYRKDSKKSINSIDSLESIYINHNLTKKENYFDSTSSLVRVDGYLPLMLYKPLPNSSSTIDKTYFMELGTSHRQYPYKLDSRYVSNEPGIISSKKDTDDDKDSQSIFYGCDPYIFIYDSEHNKQIIDPNGRPVSDYYVELIKNAIIMILSFYIIQAAIVFYLFSFCCICPCCCCYKLCHKYCCCIQKQQNYHPFDARNKAIRFLQDQNYDNAVNYDVNSNNQQNDNIANSDENDNIANSDENEIGSSSYNITENPYQNVNVVEEEEEETNVEDGLDLHDINSQPIRSANPQL